MRNRKYGVEQWKERKCFLFLFCCFTISLFSWNRKKKYIYIYIFLCLVCIKNEAKEIIIYVNDFYAPIIFKSNFHSTQQKLY